MRSFIFIALLFCSQQLCGQVTARIIDEERGTVIDGAVVTYTVKDKKKVVSTNDSGYVFLVDCKTCIATVYSELFYDLKGVTITEGTVVKLKPITIILDQVVITGQSTQSSMSKSVQKIKIIDAKTIANRAAINLKDLLMTELNIRISTDNILGSSLSIQGIGGQNIKILQDGVPIIGRLDGQLDLSQINLSNIERVEIIEGPMSTIYGTDALGGVINLISKKNIKQNTFNYSNYYETVGTINTNVGFSVKKNRSSLRVDANKNIFNGYSENEDSKLRWMQWKPKNQNNLNTSYSYTLKNISFKLSSQYFNELITSKNVPVVNSVQAYAFDDYFKTIRFNNTLFTDINFGKNRNITLTNSYSVYERMKNRYRRDLLTIQDEMTGNADQDTSKFYLVMARGIYKTSVGKKITIQSGYDINIETGTGDRLENNRQQIQDYAAFTTIDWNITKKLILKPGLRFIYNDRYGAPVIPSFNFKYFLTKNIDIKGSYGRGFRAPTLKELSLFFVDINHNIKGNENLKAEHSDNFNINISFNKTIRKILVGINASGYYNTMKNLIDLGLLDANTQLYTYLNIGNYKTHGFTIENSLKYKRVSFSLGYARMGRQNYEYSYHNLPRYNYTSEINGTIGYYNDKYKWGANLFFKHNGSVPQYVINSDGTTSQSKVIAYNMADLSIQKSFMPKNMITIVAGAKNLFDLRNINIVSSGGAHSGGGSMPIGMGRFYFLSLKFMLQSNAR
ncbi:MAG: TonB-dependent receptor [Bacteroidia bacterium]|nr:TonB-dependent receptor [Bacteroidia bacterium]